MLGTIRLDGQWQFYADEEQKYTGFLPENVCFTDTVKLPGTTAQNKKGKGGAKPEDGCLTERYPYKGNAWFRREVFIPEELRGKKLRLFLERTRITSLWVNGDFIGTQNSLCTPHVYDLTAYSGAASLMLTICVDNANYPTRGGHMTSPDTQTNWNGITGEMSLRFFDTNCITSARAVTDAEKREVTFILRTEGSFQMLRAEGGWFDKTGEILDIPSQMLTLTRNADGTSSAVMKLSSAAPLWDEYSPVIARVALRPFGSQDATEIAFGLTDFKAKGTMFTAHGKPLFLRGKHDGMIFPVEGAAPTDVESWMRVMGIAKEYGINHYRFHTCCPPDAAFTAADLLGIYMEPEIPFWGSIHAPDEEGFDPKEQTYLIEEGRKILETFGNHPSFCMFSLGNELWGSPQRMNEILHYYKRSEPRILFTQGCNNFQHFPNIQPEDDYFVGVRLSNDRLIRGSYGSCDPPAGHVQSERPSTMHCYDAIIRPDTLDIPEGADGAQEVEIQYGTGVRKVRVDQVTSGLIPEVPVITHEIGQYVTYPDFDEIPQYSGVLEAKNYEIFRNRLDKAGMLHQAKDFVQCSGKLAVQCYKEELEAAARSQYVAGYQILDIQDFTGQGTATVGILNAFMENKGLVTPEEWRGFCSDAVLLGIFPDYCVTDKLAMQVKLRYYRRERIIAGQMNYTIERGQTVLQKGTLDAEIGGQGLFELGSIEIALPPASKVHRIKVTLELEGIRNTYVLWQFPVCDMPELESTKGLTVTSDWTEAKEKLSGGGRVLFLPNGLHEKVQGYYCADFWCYPMFRSISESMGKPVAPGTLGLCIDKRHPALRDFRCEKWSTPQWYDLVSHADMAILDGTDVQPIVQMIDNFERNHKLGLLFECRVGTGKLLVCTARLEEITDRPEVHVFAKTLLDYFDSPLFQPTAEVSFAEIERILKEANT